MPFVGLARNFSNLLPIVVFVVSVFATVAACGPGGGHGRQYRSYRAPMTPFVLHQFHPHYEENHPFASGGLKGPIPLPKDDPRYVNLVPVYDEYIIFRDEEGTGHDRMMTDRCVEKLKALAISVMNQWPGVKLRVIDGWIENVRPGYPENDSLHYEGRAVDITTSDRDRSKNGMLARLAVEAGFDWVYYEAKSHIHCSVKSESSQGARTGGCFPNSGIVTVEGGIKKTLADLRVGESVLSYDKDSGRLVYSPVLMFLDRNTKVAKQFLKLKLSGGQELLVTPQHLVMRSGNNSTEGVEAVFAANLRPSDQLLVTENNGTAVVRKTLISSQLVLKDGIVAPLTSIGTVVVDDVVASCYALIENQSIAHFAFVPVRLYKSLVGFVRNVGRLITDGQSYDNTIEVTANEEGVHWYPSTLYYMFNSIIPNDLRYKY